MLRVTPSKVRKKGWESIFTEGGPPRIIGRPRGEIPAILRLTHVRGGIDVPGIRVYPGQLRPRGAEGRQARPRRFLGAVVRPVPRNRSHCRGDIVGVRR